MDPLLYAREHGLRSAMAVMRTARHMCQRCTDVGLSEKRTLPCP
jgi:hypothetical protein